MRRLLLSVMAVLAAALAGCARSAPDHVHIAHESEPISLDPAAHQESTTQSVLWNFLEPLATFDPDMRLVPCLAVNWTNPDENTWLVQLRQGVRFHDGRPLTAEDVAFTLRRSRDDPASGVRGHLSAVAAIETPDPATVRIRTTSPEPLLMSRLAYILVVPSGKVDPERPVGTGPYRFLGWQRGSALEAERFDDYWGPRPAIRRASFLAVPESEKGLQALGRREVEVLRWVPEVRVAEFRAVPGARVAVRPGLLTYYLWMNSTPAAAGQPKNPLADRRVRQALARSVDRAGIVKALGGLGEPAHQFVQKGVFGYVAGLEEIPYDPAGARKLLAEAGYADGVDVNLVHREQESLGLVARVVKESAAEGGLRLDLKPSDWQQVVVRWQAAQIPLFLGGWRFEDGDASGFLRDCLLTRAPARNQGGFNPGYSSPALDALIEENGRIFGEARRLQQYERLMRQALEEMPLVPLYHKQNLFAARSELKWEPRLDGKLLAAEMAFEVR